MDDKLEPTDATETPAAATEAETTEKPPSRVKSLIRQGVRVRSGIAAGRGPKIPVGLDE